MTRSFCRTELGQAHYATAGPAAGPPLVLLHQTPRSIDEFAELIPLLAPTARVIAIDTPGYGCSDRVAGAPSIADYARAVLAVLDREGVQRAHVFGHHTGGVTAVELAAAAPERVASVALSGPIYLDESGRAALRPLFKQWHAQADGAHLIDKWQKMSGWTTRDPGFVQRLVLDVFRAGETSEQGHFAAAAYRMEDRLPLAHCPALLVYGTHDPFASPANAGTFAASFRPCRTVTVEAGIFLPNEAAEALAPELLSLVTTA